MVSSAMRQVSPCLFLMCPCGVMKNLSSYDEGLVIWWDPRPWSSESAFDLRLVIQLGEVEEVAHEEIVTHQSGVRKFFAQGIASTFETMNPVAPLEAPVVRSESL